MQTVYRLTLAVATLALGVVLPAAAQEPPEQQSVIEQLQAKSVLTDEDQAALRGWIEQRVQAIAAGDPGGAALAAKELREAYATGTTGFKEAHTAVIITVTRAAYKQAKRDAAAQLIALLNTLDQVSTYPLLIEALGDSRVPVRTAAAIGLRRLQGKLAGAGGTVFSESIAALRDAGKRETSQVALELIYRAMDYTGLTSNRPDPQANAQALLNLLEARGRQYGARNVRAEAADRPGVELAGKLVGQLTEEERRRLVIADASMLHYAVTRYTSELHKIKDKTSSPVQIALRDRVELFIETTETLLVKLTNPTSPPAVVKAMQETEVGEKRIKMKIQMNAWGDLLQNSHQIDVHMAKTEEAEEEAATREEEPPTP